MKQINKITFISLTGLYFLLNAGYYYDAFSGNRTVHLAAIMSVIIIISTITNILVLKKNPEWELMTQDYSRKIFADYFIDDHSVGMKYIIIKNSNGEMCKTCDWQFIDEWFVQEGLYEEKVL